MTGFYEVTDLFNRGIDDFERQHEPGGEEHEHEVDPGTQEEGRDQDNN